MLLEKIGAVTRVTREWEGQTVVCIATGPSLTYEDVQLVKRSCARVIAVNDAYLWADFADAVYFADAKWYDWQQKGVERTELGFTAEDVQRMWREFKGQKCSIAVGQHATRFGPEVYRIAKNTTNGEALSMDQASICTGAHSGYQAINIACLSGGRPIILLGYDCGSKDGRDHFFGAHVDKSKPPYAGLVAHYKALAKKAKERGFEIVNATRDSAIEAFPKVDLAESLQPHQTAAVVST